MILNAGSSTFGPASNPVEGPRQTTFQGLQGLLLDVPTQQYTDNSSNVRTANQVAVESDQAHRGMCHNCNRHFVFVRRH